jgi:hypothetical protein
LTRTRVRALSAADLRSTGASVIDIYTICIYGQNAFGSLALARSRPDGAYRAGDNTGGWEIITKSAKDGGAADPFEEINTIAWKAWFGAAVLNSGLVAFAASRGNQPR